MTRDLSSSNLDQILESLDHYLIRLTESENMRLAAQKEAFNLSHEFDGPPSNSDLEQLAKLAQKEYAERMQRSVHFSSDLLGEPAWDILLDLFIARVSDARISTTSSCIASRVPTTTALRCLASLARHGLIARRDDPADKRRYWIELTSEGFEKMVACLRERSAGGICEVTNS